MRDLSMLASRGFWIACAVCALFWRWIWSLL